jgi:hypothetical protein
MMGNTSEAAQGARRINNALVEYRARLEAEKRELAHRRNRERAIVAALERARATAADLGVDVDEVNNARDAALEQVRLIIEAEPESGACSDCGAVFDATHRPVDEPCPRCGHYRAWGRIS